MKPSQILKASVLYVAGSIALGALLAWMLIHRSGHAPPQPATPRRAPRPARATAATPSRARPRPEPISPIRAMPPPFSPPVASNVYPLVHLFDSFESGNHWAAESADDHAALSISTAYPSQGDRCLHVEFETFGKGKFQIRRDARLDLSQVRQVSLDICNQSGPLEATLGLQVNHDDAGIYESPRVSLPTGWSKGVRFRLDAGNFLHGGKGEPTAVERRDRVSRLALTFYEGANASGSLYIDNITFEYTALPVARDAKPVIRRVVASRNQVRVFDTLELTVRFDAGFQDFFDRGQIDLFATFFSPSGRTITVHGFLYDYRGPAPKKAGKRTEKRGQQAADPARQAQPLAPEPAPEWRIRFTPSETGRWVYDVSVRNRHGETVTPLGRFLCTPDPRRKGFVRVSPGDKRYFECDNGDFYYPIGQNVAWAANMGHYVKRISAYRGDLVRIWLCPWHLPLELRSEPGKYDLLVAKQLDALLELAAAHNVRVQVVLQYHGMLIESWPANPYNAANRGPCAEPEDFFTDPTAQAHFKRMLDYIAARWAHSPAVFAWELWNEVDHARYRSFDDVVAWHREMIAHLRQADPYRHLITTSIGGEWRDDLLGLHGIDFISAHLYGPNLPDRISDALRAQRKYGKPFMIGEFAGSAQAADVAADPQGVRFQAGLWLSSMTPTAGAALGWWWDTHIEAHHLYPRLAALARFWAGEDRRGKSFHFVRSELPLGPAREPAQTKAHVWGIISPGAAYLWVHDPDRLASPQKAHRPFIRKPTSFQIEGVLGGVFLVEIWDTQTGKLVRQERISSRDGRLTLPLPASPHPLALKVKKPGFRAPRIVP